MLSDLHQERERIGEAIIALERLATPVVLFDPHVMAVVSDPHDVTSDGKRFLTVTGSGAASTPLTVVTNWTAGLKK